MAEVDALAEGAKEWLGAARTEQDEGRYRVAYEAARHAAELAAKVLLLKEGGSYPQRHDVSSDLERADLRPSDVKLQDLRKLLSSHTLGTYGFAETIHRKDARQAIRVAERMVDAVG